MSEAIDDAEAGAAKLAREMLDQPGRVLPGGKVHWPSGELVDVLGLKASEDGVDLSNPAILHAAVWGAICGSVLEFGDLAAAAKIIGGMYAAAGRAE